MKKWIDSIINTIRGPRKKVILIAAFVIAVITISSLVALWISETTTIHFPSVGNLRTSGVSIYDDPYLQNITKIIQWGTIYPGSETGVTKYIRSMGDSDAILEIETEKWVFTDSYNNNVNDPANRSPYMFLESSHNRTIIRPGQVIQVTLTLTVEDNPAFVEFLVQANVRGFSFDINVRATDQ